MGVAAKVALSGKAFASGSPSENTAFCPGLDAPAGVHARNMLSVPLQPLPSAGDGPAVGGRLAQGALQAVNKRVGAFTMWDKQALATLAHETLVRRS